MNAPPARTANPLAIVSLVAGALGLLPLPLAASVVAVITGHLARAEIARHPDRYDGEGIALAGLILGYTMIALCLLGLVLLLFFFGGLVWLGLQN